MKLSRRWLHRCGGYAAYLLTLGWMSRLEYRMAITPDGPRGPRRRLPPGCIYLASRLEIPLICMGFGFHRPWRVTSARDRFAVPRPFSRARGIVSPPIAIPPHSARRP